MFAALPQALKEKVVSYLATDNFVAAKAIHDAWIASQQQTAPQAVECENYL